MDGFRDTLENMQNDVRDIKHNVRDLMPDVRTLRNNFGAIHKEVNKMRCSDAQLMAIVCVSLNNLDMVLLNGSSSRPLRT